MPVIKLPGLIDPHVHLRDPDQTEKEDFFTGTYAALCGGFTTILDMPNNKLPITTLAKLNEKINAAKEKILCDVGFYFGSLGNNLSEFIKIKNKVFGLKLYLNVTTGNYLIGEKEMEKIYNSWTGETPILLHAEEGGMLEKALNIIKKTGKRTHVCHVSSAEELELVISAKKGGLPVTCGVTPHHLFLTEEDAKSLGSFGLVKPFLKKSKDREFLWKHLDAVDVIESDHAPHTIAEKRSDKPPFGLPGLETTLPLLLTEVNKKRLTLEEIIKLCYANPKKIFNIPTDNNTYIEVDMNKTYTIDNGELKTKCGWSPFDGWKVKGRVGNVVIRGKQVINNNHELLVKPGSGQILCPRN